MKKTYLLSAVALLSIGLAACSSKGSTGSTSSKTEQVGSAANRKIAKELAAELNKDGKIAKVTVEPEVRDDQSKKNDKGEMQPHEVINAIITDKKIAKTLDADKEAISNDTATNDQKMYLLSMQEIVSNAAKKLNNSNDTVELNSKMSEDNYNVYALSTKDKDVIEHVTIDVQ